MVTTQVYSTWTLTWKGYNCRGFSVSCHPKCSPVSFQPHFQQEVVWGHRLVTRCPGPGMPVQSPQTTLSLTTGCVLSVAAGTRPQLWINKEWQQRGLPAFIASASSEWMDIGDLILGGSERSAPSCATCLPPLTAKCLLPQHPHCPAAQDDLREKEFSASFRWASRNQVSKNNKTET